MRARSGTTALVATFMIGAMAASTTAGAQGSAPADSAPHFALFGGTAATENLGPENGLEVGVSGDLRWRPIPVPLRLSASFSQRRDAGRYYAPTKGGLASIEAVMRPIPKWHGLQPYFLGGLGVGTRAGFGYWTGGYFTGVDFTQPTFVSRPRDTWAFASAGVGLDVGRAFVQLRVLNPVASQGPILVPLSVGFRFWD